MLLFLLLLSLPSPWPVDQVQGVTFSVMQAEGLGLNWKEAYGAVLEDLGVKRLRLVAQWDRVEKKRGKYDFAELDYQVNEAERLGAGVVLAVGRKVPRWPECHVPAWAVELPEAEQQALALEYAAAVAERYRSHPALRMWQVENEPLLDFGECPPADENFLAAEEKLLREKGGGHPILVTDSGELNWWLDASRYGDVLGTTMYRTVWSQRTDKLFRYDYLFPAWLYRAKARVVKLWRSKPVLIAELQGEPWGRVGMKDMTFAEREESLSPERLKQVASFARRTQLPEAYWWGAEYWYWEKMANGNPEYWDAAREFFRGSRAEGGG